MLLFVVPAVCLILGSIGVMLCRVASLSDESHTLAVSEWLAAGRPGGAQEAAGSDDAVLRERGRGGYRATG